ncbi:MAG: SDR family oxidoreductase, partial [Acidimicrobiales bacterium]
MGHSALAPDANQGQVAVISGGGTGIGRATAIALAGTGASVVICGRRAEPLETTCREMASLGTDCLAVPADICQPDDVTRVIDGALERFGQVDIVVNNAGGQFTAAAEDISVNGWRAVHRLSVEAAWSLTREAAVRSMIPRRRGVVVFVGFSPRRGLPGMVHAAAARAAVENLAGGLACEWSRYGIRAVCVAPGNIATEGLDQYGAEQVAAWERAVPLGRLGTAAEVGDVIGWLVSPAASYITGTTIVVDGGVDAWGQAEP